MLAIRDSKRLKAIVMTVLGKGGPSLFVDLGGFSQRTIGLRFEAPSAPSHR